MSAVADTRPTLPLRLLRCVVAVAQTGSAARAAPLLHLSASATTRAVQRSEALAGLPLFVRVARGMAPTEACRILVLRGQRALQGLADASKTLRTRHRAGSGPCLSRSLDDGMLAALDAVADLRSEAAVARRLGLSQPAVHQTLRRTEHAARVSLFERSPRGTRLTEAGDTLLTAARIAVAELRIGLEELHGFLGGGAQLTIGALPMACDVLVPQALTRLLASRPGVHVTIVDGTYDALVQLLRQARIDLLVGPLRRGSAAADLVEQTLVVDHLAVAARHGHPAFATRRRPTLGQLCAWPWIGPLPDTPAQAAFERAFAAAGVAAPTPTLQSHSTAVVRSVLMASEHLTLISPLQIRAEVDSGLLAIQSLVLQGVERHIGVTQRREGLPSPAAAAMLQELQAVGRSLTAP
jgi:LysR family transcriptional regulator, regulator for genes of the gallate degradation pathway